MRLKNGGTVVVANSVLSQQFEAYLSPAAPEGIQPAWSSIPILTYQAWIKKLWSEIDSIDTPRLLNVRQERALWRRVIRDSEAAPFPLTNLANVSRWAADAWWLLHQWKLDNVELLRFASGLDSDALINWHRRFSEILAERGWIDRAQLEYSLTQHLTAYSEGPVTWAQFSEETPAQGALFDHLLHQGWKMSRWETREVESESGRVCLPDGAAEIKAAARWAASRLDKSSSARIAVVVADLDERRSQVNRIFADTLHPQSVLLGSEARSSCWIASGEEYEFQPALGAALTALELLSPSGSFFSFSRWLRSPFFDASFGSASDRALLEIRLRNELFSQLGFVDALTTGGLSGFLQQYAPRIALVMGDLNTLVNSIPHRCTPTQWAQIWQKILSLMGWPAGVKEDQSNKINQLWEVALCDFASLTPVVRAISMGEALIEIKQTLQGRKLIQPIPVNGVCLLGRIEDVGPGYDGVWVTGMTDHQWPKAHHPNPLLPRALQHAHNMPGSSPHKSLERSRLLTKRLLSSSPIVIFSWPGMIRDYPVNPSPLILETTSFELEDIIVGSERRFSNQLFGTLPKEILEDKAPPLLNSVISGGVSALNSQAVCPLRAFCEYRLDAKPLEIVRRGLDPRRRGIITHRAVELAWQRFSDQGAINDLPQTDRNAWFQSCAERALLETFGPLKKKLAAFYNLELRRLELLLSALADCDLNRSLFRVETLEKRVTIKLSGFSLVSRIDRVDRLENGGLVIIDYKTGSRARPADWLKFRLVDTQIPLYTLAVEEPVRAAVIGILRTREVRYRGFWDQVDSFPGSPESLSRYQRSWADQQKVWREQLTTLLEEFSQGDVHLSVSELKEVKGIFAPLTRVYEQLALARSNAVIGTPHER